MRFNYKCVTTPKGTLELKWPFRIIWNWGLWPGSLYPNPTYSPNINQAHDVGCPWEIDVTWVERISQLGHFWRTHLRDISHHSQKLEEDFSSGMSVNRASKHLSHTPGVRTQLKMLTWSKFLSEALWNIILYYSLIISCTLILSLT